MMKMPKYTPGQVVIIQYERMKTIQSAYLTSEFERGVAPDEWRYDAGGSIFNEQSVTHVLNGNLWVPAGRWNGPTEAVDRSEDVEAVLYEDVDEFGLEALAEANGDIYAGPVRKRIEVKDATQER